MARAAVKTEQVTGSKSGQFKSKKPQRKYLNSPSKKSGVEFPALLQNKIRPEFILAHLGKSEAGGTHFKVTGISGIKIPSEYQNANPLDPYRKR